MFSVSDISCIATKPVVSDECLTQPICITCSIPFDSAFIKKNYCKDVIKMLQMLKLDGAVARFGRTVNTLSYIWKLAIPVLVLNNAIKCTKLANAENLEIC